MTKFSDLKLDPKVLQAVAEAGYENPTPIQSGAIPPALEGRDVLGIAQTGTGKTASFTLPMITLLGRGRARARMPRSLVLCPTRELAAQVAENFDTYAKHTRLTKALLIGGVSFNEQDKLIDRGVDVLIATPGRLLDHFERGKLLLTGVQIMVVDEADRMLDMGFIPDIERIFQLTPFTRQTLFFSATMAPEIERITNTFLHAPERIEVARQATTSETIAQRLIEITPTRKDQSAKQKRELLRAIIDSEGEALKNAIIFCNRKTDVDIVAKSLKAHGYDAAPIHGDLDQRVRMATLDGFRDGSLRFLVASDVAARGLDIPAVSHVINFDLPSHAEDYVHRIGRTGRAGRQGTAISIGTPGDDKYLAAIEALVKQTLPRGTLPEGFHISDAAQKAPRPVAERGTQRGAPTRTRSRRGSSRDEAATNAGAEVTEVAAVVERTVENPVERSVEKPTERAERIVEKPVEKPVEARKSNGDSNAAAPAARDERDDRNRDRRDAPRDDRREDRRDDRRDRYRDRDRGPSLLGMGEHTPDFLLTSFSEALAITEERMSSAAARSDDTTKVEAQSAETQTAVEPTETTRSADADAAATPRRTRSRRSRSGRGAKETTAEDATGQTTVAEDAAQQPDTEGPVDATPTQAAAAQDAAPEGVVTQAEAAPAATPVTAPVEAVASDDAVVEAVVAADDGKPAKPAPKPRAPRTRRKPVKADDEAAADEAAPTADAPAVEAAAAKVKPAKAAAPKASSRARASTKAAKAEAEAAAEATSDTAKAAPVSDSSEQV